MWRCTIFGELCAANEFMEFRSFDVGHSREPEALPSQFEYLRIKRLAFPWQTLRVLGGASEHQNRKVL